MFKLFLNNLPSCFDASDDRVILENVSFGCLMYADDLVLLFTTEKGLQSCLNKLSIFCDAHGLTVNLKKTNIMTFSKSGRNSKTRFMFNKAEIKEGQIYKYLWILFSPSGTFSYCQNDLYKRGLKANFKIGKCFGDLHQNVDTV